MQRSIALLLVSSGLLSAQNPPACPEVRFAIGYAVKTYLASGSGAYHSTLVPNPDGSLNDIRFQPFAPYKKISETPSAESQLWACAGLPPRVMAGRGDGTEVKFGQESPGVGSRPTRVIGLDAGRLVVVSVNSRAARSKLTTVRVKPDHTLEQQVNYDTAPNPEGLVVGEFTGDGIADVAVTAFGDFSKGTPVISIYPGAADGSFGARIDTALAQLASSIAAGDLNGDGKLDLVATDGNNQRMAFLAGKGDGTFAAPVYVKTTGYEMTLAVTDINADGRLDVLLGPSQSGVNYLPGNGDGTFRALVPVTATGSARYLGVGDFNEDGRLDVVMTDSDVGVVRILLAQPNGTFADAGAAIAGYSPVDFVISDLDHDGHLDVLLGATDPSALNRGDNYDLFVAMFGLGDGTFAGAQTRMTARAVQAMAVADLNGDQMADVVIGTGSQGGVSVLLGQAGGGLGAEKTVALPLPAGRSQASVVELLIADFNQDGKPDLAAALDGERLVAVLPGRGDGSFGPGTALALAASPRTLASGDFNGDGRLDLAVVSQASTSAPPSTLNIYLGTAAGTFAAPRTSTTGQMLGALAAGDFNQDGKLDLVASDYGNPSNSTPNGGVLLLAGDGAGAFQPPVTLLKDFQSAALASGDLNGDGITDVIASGMGLNFAFRLYVLQGKPGGGLAEPVAVPTDFGPARLVVGDFSDDGIPDVAVAHCCGDTYLGIHPGNGDGTLKPEILVEQLSAPARMAAADVDGDGRLDLIAAFQQRYGSGGSGLLVARNAKPRINTLKLANGASGQATATAAAGSLVRALGRNLATGEATGELSALPESLGGASLKVVDSAGAETTALIYSVKPAEVRFVLPAVAAGPAVVTLLAADGQTWTAPLEVTSVSPGLFSVNAAGTAQGYLVRELADGTASAEEFTTTNPETGALEPLAIDMGAEDTKIYLVLYGTGLRGVSSLEALTATAGGEVAPVTDVHANDSIPALDEIRLLLPRALVGKGVVELVTTADGVASNAVKIRVQ